ncbi:cytochrome c [Acetobacter sp. LMG 32666]|uniref:c-type cytochrome n=1 Tax=Acetobacter sp. LMG 32666 TaxID=2959295 RepID=UPI0030C82F09
MMFFSFPLRAAALACMLACLPHTGGAWAQSYTTGHTGGRAGAVQPVSFSAEQVAHGAQIYAGACAMCHGADLEGGHDVPDLSTYFTARWANTPLDRLAGYIAHAMPLMAPGTLPPQDTAALVAFILHHNGATSATNAPLPMEDARLAKFRFPAPLAQPPATGGKP